MSEKILTLNDIRNLNNASEEILDVLIALYKVEGEKEEVQRLIMLLIGIGVEITALANSGTE